MQMLYLRNNTKVIEYFYLLSRSQKIFLIIMKNTTFSGHESFNCRPLWLKKGYDFIQDGFDFNADDAVVGLGVGKNMVRSINYWVKSFGLVRKNSETNLFADYIFGENGKDHYLEDPASLWLLHYYLIKENQASIYSLFFNEFRKYSPEFSKERLERFILRYCNENNITQSENTIERDARVFLKNYGIQNSRSRDVEDEFSSLFLDLNLFEKIAVNTYRVVNKERRYLPYLVVLFIILDKYEEQKSISFHNLLNDENSVGNVLVMNEQGLLNKINEIISEYSSVVFSDVAGIKELQLKRKLDKWKVLDKYYEK